jgi:hypothetical protein
MRMFVILLFGLVGCTSKPSAADVCKRLEAAGVAKGCREEKPEVMTARAKVKYGFDLPSVPGKTGQVLTFADAEAYTATVQDFEKVAPLAGPHRFGSEKALVFVQLNSGASLETGKTARGIVEGL